MSEYTTAQKDYDPDWEPLLLWLDENPNSENTDSWYSRKRVVMDRVWVGYCLPQFKESVWDWSDARVEIARQFVSGLFCGVCGRQEDPGCVLGC